MNIEHARADENNGGAYDGRPFRSSEFGQAFGFGVDRVLPSRVFADPYPDVTHGLTVSQDQLDQERMDGEGGAPKYDEPDPGDIAA